MSLMDKMTVAVVNMMVDWCSAGWDTDADAPLANL
jgi:hypothetical protein